MHSLQSNVFDNANHTITFLRDFVLVWQLGFTLSLYILVSRIIGEGIRPASFFKKTKLVMNPLVNMNYTASYFSLHLRSAWKRITAIIKVPLRLLTNSWRVFSLHVTSVCRLLLLSLLFFLSIFAFIIMCTYFGICLIAVLLVIPLFSLLFSLPLFAVTLVGAFEAITDLPFFYSFETSSGIKRLVRYILVTFYFWYLICVSVTLALIMVSCVRHVAYTFIAILLFLNELLPYVTFSLIALAFLWGFYSSITEKYLSLRVLLFKSCREVDQTLPQTEQSNQLIYLDANKVPRLPERLFDAACAEILPVKKTILLSILSFSCTIFFFFFIFACILAFGKIKDNESAVIPLVQSTVTLFIGTLPKLISLFRKPGIASEVESVKVKDCIEYVIMEFRNGERQCRSCSEGTQTELDVQLQ